MKKLLLFSVCVLTMATAVAQCPYYLNITTQAEIDAFSETYPNCTGSALFLDINGQNSDITNLNGLSQLTSIVRLGIFYSNITDLSGLDNITTVFSGLFLLGNNELVSLHGVNSLETVGDRLRVVLNNQLPSLNGLENLTEVGGELGIELNGQLESLSGLNNLERIGETLKILSNPNLTGLQGLESLQEVGTFAEDELYVFNNPLIENMAGLENLQQINGTLNLRGNNALASIAELTSLQAVSTQISFQSNSLLSFCAIDVICNNLENIGVELVFENNASGCNSREEVEDSCRLLSVTEPSLEETVLIYPNPVSDLLRIQSLDEVEIQHIKIYSATGEEVVSSSAKEINLSRLSSGIYFLELHTEVGTFTRKIVKD